MSEDRLQRPVGGDARRRPGRRSEQRPAEPTPPDGPAPQNRPARAGEPALDVAALQVGAAAVGVTLTTGQVARFSAYAAELVAWNKHTNLTRLVSPSDISVGHVADSLACHLALPQELRDASGGVTCVDVGSGAGLPGLPLAVLFPAWHVTLMEASSRKADFLRHAAWAMDLGNVTVLPERAEVAGQAAAHRERYDLAVARAVAPLPVLLEYALPLVRVGGRLLALAGGSQAPDARAHACRHALDLLGGRWSHAPAYRLPGLATDRHVVAIHKAQPTPAAYPRRPGVPARRPLGGRP